MSHLAVLRTLLEALPLLCVIHRAGRVKWVNSATASFNHVQPRDLIGLRTRVLCERLCAQPPKRPTTELHWCARKPGWFRITTVALRGGAVVAVAEDMTARFQLLAQRRLLTLSAPPSCEDRRMVTLLSAGYDPTDIAMACSVSTTTVFGWLANMAGVAPR